MLAQSCQRRKVGILRPLIPTLACCVALVAVPHASASDHTNPTPVPCGHVSKLHTHKSQPYKTLAQNAWSQRRWRQRDPRSGRQKRTLYHRRACARNEATRSRMERSSRNARKAFKRHRREQRRLRRSDCIAGVTVYSYGRQCTAIPGYIVGCESKGDWGAYNPSGAAAIYQIMPEHGRPFPINSVEDKRTHHRIAHRLYAGGSGASNWVCA